MTLQSDITNFSCTTQRETGNEITVAAPSRWRRSHSESPVRRRFGVVAPSTASPSAEPSPDAPLPLA